jgi:hypothetical protein
MDAHTREAAAAVAGMSETYGWTPSPGRSSAASRPASCGPPTARTASSPSAKTRSPITRGSFGGPASGWRADAHRRPGGAGDARTQGAGDLGRGTGFHKDATQRTQT